MLKQMRSRAKGVMFWTLVLIIPSFVFFYGWNKSQQQGGGGGRSMVSVRDRWAGLRWRDLSAFEQERAQESLINRYARELSSRGLPAQNPQELRGLAEDRDVAEETANAYLLRRFAHEKGLSVTIEELQEQIAMALQSQGATANDFRNLLRQQRKSEKEYLQELAYDMELNKAYGYITSRAKASLYELWQEYLIGQEKIQLSYVRVPAKEFAEKVQPTSDSLKQFYAAQKEDYRVGEKVSFRYAAILRDKIAEAVNPTTDVVKAFYDKHPEQFTQPRSATVRHILIDAPPDAPTTAAEAARTQAQVLEAQIRQGADFAQLADQHSQDPENIDTATTPTATKRGGLLPFPVTEKGVSRFGETFKQAALSLDANEVSSPVRSSRGFHLIKADKVSTGGVQPFDEVKEQAFRAAKDDLVNAEFQKRGEALRRLFTERTFTGYNAFVKFTRDDAAASTLGLTTGTTELLDLQAAFIPGIGSIAEQRDLIVDLKPGDFSEAVFRSPTAYYVLELTQRVPSRVPPFEEVATDVRDDYVSTQSAQLALTAARDLAKAKSLDELRKLVEPQGRKVEQTDLVTRENVNTLLPNLDQEFAYETLRAQPNSIHVVRQGSPDAPLAYVVWHLDKREEPTMEQFRKDLPQIRAEYIQQTQQALLLEWLKDAREKARVKINMPEQEEEQPKKDQAG